MAHIVICDKEDRTRQFFLYHIERLFTNSHTISEMSDPEDLATILAKGPDIFIMDVGFFGLSPFPKLEKILSLHPHVLFIIYGPILDDLYIRKLSEYNLIDYLYRPIRPPEFENALERAFRSLSKQREVSVKEAKLMESYNNQMNMFLDQFLFNLSRGLLKNEFEILDAFSYFNLDMQSPYGFMIVQLDYFRSIALTLDELEKHLLVYNILQIVKNVVEVNGIGTGLVSIDQMNLLLILFSDNRVLKDQIFLGNEIIDKIKKTYDISVTIGLGNVYEKVLDVAYSYEEAKRALLYREYYGNDTVLPIEFLEPHNVFLKTNKDFSKKFVEALLVGSETKATGYINDFAMPLEQNELPTDFYSNQSVAIIMMLRQEFYPINKEIYGIIPKVFPASQITKIKTKKDFFDFLLEGTKEICHIIKDNRNEKLEKLTKKAKAYQEKNYMKPISLDDIAFNLHTTKNFLKEAMDAYSDQNLFDYTVSKRIKEAKVLMANTNLSDEAIADMVGYDDVRYFRSVFQSHENLHTYEYRLKMQM